MPVEQAIQVLYPWWRLWLFSTSQNRIAFDDQFHLLLGEYLNINFRNVTTTQIIVIVNYMRIWAETKFLIM